MKEVTEWDNRPRLMWVWDEDDEDKKYRLFVVYIAAKVNRGQKRVLSVNTVTHTSKWYDHCAEITDEEKRMTNKQLSDWLAEDYHREYVDTKYGLVHKLVYAYYDIDRDIEVSESIRIRENNGEWREPLVELMRKASGPDLTFASGKKGVKNADDIDSVDSDRHPVGT